MSIHDEPTAAGAAVRGDHPARIGPYRILQLLGEGGMGVVYAAEQTAPISRRVAVKVLKLGMDTRQFVARFEAERQALAVMDHPGIARVFDAGATDSGRPYCVMELVHGVPITEYCDNNRLQTRERIELVIGVCHAVQHAHQKGVIHRDLKPSNVLVSLQDGNPAPKIIDFGLAKATDRQLTNLTLYTEVGQRVGTPAYMSPEQMEMSGLDIDTRTDIYSLGVMLYELLTGALPFSEDFLRRAVTQPQLMRETDPPTPSSRVTSLGEAGSAVASRRQSDPASLRHTLAGDLDWITLKAMAIDRTRRYDTANGLAMDLQRYLAFEPVTARPPSTGDRVSKFVRRHRLAVGFAAVVAMVVVAAALGLAVQAQRLARERDRAESQAARANAIAGFLQDTLSSADPWRGGNREVSILEALRAATAKVDPAFRDQPLEAAAVRRTIAATYAGLGELDEAETLGTAALARQREILGSASEDVAETLAVLADIQSRQGQYERAEASAREALAVRLQLAGQDAAVAASLSQLAGVLEARGEYQEAKARAEESLAIRRRVHGARHDTVADSLKTLGDVTSNGFADFVAADALYGEELEIRRSLGGDDAKVAVTLNNLAVNQLRLERYPQAEALYLESLALHRRLLGEDHPEVAATLENLGGVYYRTKRYDQTLALLDQVLAMRRRRLGDQHTAVGRTLHNIGVVRSASRDFTGAVASLTDGEARLRATLGPQHPELVTVLTNLGDALNGAGDQARAEQRYRDALALAQSTLPADHPDLTRARRQLGNLLVAGGRYADAEPLLLAAAQEREKRFGLAHANTRASAADLVRLYTAWGRPDEIAVWQPRASPP